MSTADAFRNYQRQLNRMLNSGEATEHSHRPALCALIESLGRGLEAVNEPRRQACGAPDILVRVRPRTTVRQPDRHGWRALPLLSIGHVETKDIGQNLSKAERSEQMRRYLAALDNLVLTDYLTFRFYRDGERVAEIVLGEMDARGRVRLNPEVQTAFETQMAFFCDARDNRNLVGTTGELSVKLAGLTRLTRNAVEKALGLEREENKADSRASLYEFTLHAQLAAFRQVLIEDLSEDDFADIYAQTACYGLFATWLEREDDAEPFSRRSAHFALPDNNPFLSHTYTRMVGADVDDSIAWIIDALADVLDRTDRRAIREEFRDRGRRSDPLVHFYEDFLREYDPRTREARGVYYTPEPVVDYIVRSIDKLLKTELAIEDGLADRTKIAIRERDGGEERETHRLHIMDPATGTGTFLHQLIQYLYHDRFNDMGGAWPGYVRDHLLPRIHGFELLMAPYAVAHMKLNLQQRFLHCRLQANERFQVFLTNALEEPHDIVNPPLFTGWLADEARAATAVKRDLPVMAVIGNPPYQGRSENPSQRPAIIPAGHDYEVYDATRKRPVPRTAKRETRKAQRTFIGHLLRGWDSVNNRETESYFHLHGRPLDEKNPKWLNNDYVKFIRFAQWRVAETGRGVVGFVTSNSYLDGPIHRAMRASLTADFDLLYILNLHGNAKKKEKAPDGGPDENVFEITEGVSILLAVRKPKGGRDTAERPARVFYADLWGARETRDAPRHPGRTPTGGKYRWLSENDVATTDWRRLEPRAPYHLFVPMETAPWPEYDRGLTITDIFPVNVLGFQSHRDHFAVAFEKRVVERRVASLLDTTRDDEELYAAHRIKANRDWNLPGARKRLRGLKSWNDRIIKCAYRPFDERWCFYDEAAMDYPRRELLDHVFRRDNLCLNVVRQTKAEYWRHAIVSDKPAPAVYVEIKDGSTIIPLYLYPADSDDMFARSEAARATGPDGRKPNVSAAAVAAYSSALNLRWVADGEGDGETSFGPEDLFHYIYAVLNSPAYRRRFDDFLRIDFPRVRTPADASLFRSLAALGKRLVGLHLPRENPAGPLPAFPADGDALVESPRYAPPTSENAAPNTDPVPGRVWINGRQYFDGVRRTTWETTIGGYQVLDKWLKDRKGRALSFDDIQTYRRIVGALEETADIAAAIDDAIERAGGWPIGG